MLGTTPPDLNKLDQRPASRAQKHAVFVPLIDVDKKICTLKLLHKKMLLSMNYFLATNKIQECMIPFC